MANATGAAELRVSIFEFRLVARMNQIHRILALTPYNHEDYRNSPEKKILKKYERSRNVYENKRNMGDLPDKNSDIFV